MGIGRKGGREREVAQSCPTLCDPMDCSLPGSPIHGIFQARVLENQNHVLNQKCVRNPRAWGCIQEGGTELAAYFPTDLRLSWGMSPSELPPGTSTLCCRKGGSPRPLSTLPRACLHLEGRRAPSASAETPQRECSQPSLGPGTCTLTA